MSASSVRSLPPAKMWRRSSPEASHTAIRLPSASQRPWRKRTQSGVPFVLAYAPGEVRIGCEVASAALRDAVEELTR